MNWHDETLEKLNKVIVAAKLIGYNVLPLKSNKIWITNGNIENGARMIQIEKYKEDLYKLRYNDQKEKDRIYTFESDNSYIHTLEELEEKIAELL